MLFAVLLTDGLSQTVPLFRLDSSQPSLTDGNGFGRAVAVSDRYVLVGEPGNDSISSLRGTVEVFDVRSGRSLRRLRPTEPFAEGFGESVALCGHLAVVGMTGANSGRGAAHLFDLRSGQLLRSFTTSDADAALIGWRVAVSKGRVAVSSRAQEEERGAVYVFDLNLGGDPLLKLEASDRAVEDQFGHSLAFSGDTLAVGALLEGNYKGAVYLCDASQPGPVGSEFLKIVPGDLAGGDLFGSSVGLLGTTLVAGARGQNMDRGAVYQYELSGDLPVLLRKLTLSGAAENAEFGETVALEDNLIAVGAPGDDDLAGRVTLFNARNGGLISQFLPAGQNQDARHGRALALGCGHLVMGAPSSQNAGGYRIGAAWLVRSLARSLAFNALARTGGSAAGVVGGVHGAFSEVFVNADAQVCFTGALGGSGAAGGKNFGVWATASDGSLRLQAQVRAALADAVTAPTPGAVLKSLSAPLTTWTNFTLLSGRLSGPGISKGNEQVLLSHDSSVMGAFLRCGETSYPYFPIGERLESLPEVTQNRLMFIARHRLQRGQGGVDKNNDTGTLMWTSGFGFFDSNVREGMDLGSGRRLGEVSGPVAGGAAFFPWSGLVAPLFDADDKPRRAVFAHYSLGMNPTPTVIGLEGEVAPGLTQGEVFSGFPGITTASNTQRIFRATLKTGGSVNRGNNEGLWLETLAVIARKGVAPDPALPQQVFDRFLGFWPADESKVVIHASLRGPGVSAANDGGLWLWDDNGGSPVMQRLLREGDAVSLPDCPRVGVIQRVDVETDSGCYAVLTSLTGSAGNTTDQQTLRQAAPRLRKGTRAQAPLSDTVVLNGLSLTPVTDRYGAGGRGAGHIINGLGVIALQVRYSNRVSEILLGRP
jgi:hypothetical protein